MKALKVIWIIVLYVIFVSSWFDVQIFYDSIYDTMILIGLYLLLTEDKEKD